LSTKNLLFQTLFRGRTGVEQKGRTGNGYGQNDPKIVVFKVLKIKKTNIKRI